MKKNLHFIIPVIAVILCSFLVLTSLDKKVADIFQRPLRQTKQSDNVMMINIDDSTVDQIGSWPFSRRYYADALISLRELGAEAVVFDLSFLDASDRKVDQDYVENKLPAYVADNFSTLNGTLDYVMDSIKDGSISRADIPETKEALFSLIDEAQNGVNVAISYSVEDVDEKLAQAIKFLDNTYLTLTLGDQFGKLSEDFDQYLKDNLSLKNIIVDNDTKTPSYTSIEPALESLTRQARSSGFVNADADKDGYLRRLHLVMKYNNDYYGQLVFVPILNHFGNPKVEISDSAITLKNALFPDGTIKDIKIPRAEDGSVLIKYPNCDYLDYNAITLWTIYRLSKMEENLFANITQVSELGYFSEWTGNDPVDLQNAVQYIKDYIQEYGEDEEAGYTYEAYSDYIREYLSTLYEILNGTYFEELVADLDEDWAVGILQDAEILKENFTKYYDSRVSVEKQVKNAICIVGTNATSTTDFGLNQYQEKYPNPGVHYVLTNQILNQDFVDDSPFWVSIVIAFAFCMIYAFVTSKITSTRKQIVTGISALIVTIGALFGYFAITKQYVGLVVPLASVFISFIAITILGFLTASKDKKFITNAFSQCLSKEVVADIVANPSSFKLGGQRLEMSAIFTDIQKFSSFSELLTAGQLVALLNYYLTKMSDIIMGERGTVDKYEGDAIIALVGAPVKMDDHAARACAAAIKMKKAEVVMNKEIVEITSKGEKPEEMDDELYEAFTIMVKNGKSLFTRIGINSGEMIAGYMGSENKKNYTMMGNNVNLASRLEGVNKQYSTGGILISEATRKDLGDRFIVRSLDRVRVVNVNTPIRLYELVDEKELADENTVKYMENWEKTMQVFEAKDYAKALAMFSQLVKINPNDKVAKYYEKLVANFFVKGKYPTEEDGVGVEYNPEDGVFKLLQK